MTTTTTTASKILYIDDDSDDCIFLMESFMATANNTDFVCLNDGEAAIDYLNRIHEQQEAFPQLIILDLNMPRIDGRKTLSYIKSHDYLASIPVVVLSTSDNNTDKEACAQLGAASYFQKPYHYNEYKSIVNDCIHFIKA
jgi:CheY-like chemotaxis protein